ncbi:MAG: YebC/PmpR family DNA-binding transcriptional regulator [Clostridia bacterium]|nr:YebC/PmpR family DNA-binding transcriptional regulator [Clostridia bacterium]
MGVNFLEAEIKMIPQTYITLPDDKLATFQKMLDKLEELDDVQNVYHNVELPEEDED